MHTRETRRREPFFFTGAIDADAIEISLRGVLRRREEVNPTVCRINSLNTNHVVIAARDRFHVAAVARNRVNVPPAVTLAGPQKAFAAIDPLDVAARQSG